MFCIHHSPPAIKSRFIFLSFHWQWLFSPHVFSLIGLPLKPSPPSSPFPFRIFPFSLWLLFGLRWNFDVGPLPCYRELNMPCPDLLSAVTLIPLASMPALKPSENALFSEKHIIQIASDLVKLFWGDFFLFFLLFLLHFWLVELRLSSMHQGQLQVCFTFIQKKNIYIFFKTQQEGG